MPRPAHRLSNKRFVVLLALLAVSGLLLFSSLKRAPACPAKRQTSPSFQQESRPTGTLYTLIVPADSPYVLALGVSPALAGLEAPDWQAAAGLKAPIFLINAGFFDPRNRQTTSYLARDGVITDDPTRNARLMDNPQLTSYLPAILNRSEFRVYRCRTKPQAASGAGLTGKTDKRGGQAVQAQEAIRYDIVPHDTPVPETCRILDAAGAGPSLLPRLMDKEEAFVEYDASGRLTRDPIGVRVRNARSVIGLTDKGDVILMLGAQQDSTAQSSSDKGDAVKAGFTLPEMTAFLKDRGAVKAMALDGGSSSGVLYRDRVIYGKLNADGSPVKRPVKSVWMVVPQ